MRLRSTGPRPGPRRAEGQGGNPGRVERWGRRPSPTSCQHKREGYYVVIELNADRRPSRHGAVFVLADEVLRHKVIRLPDKVAGRRAAAAASAANGEA